MPQASSLLIPHPFSLVLNATNVDKERNEESSTK
jgi:hypothetical protein